MFTGLVAELGQVVGLERSTEGARMTISSRLAGQLEQGDSVAVNGVCLTALEPTGDRFNADLSAETVERSTLAQLSPGAAVNLELAMRPDDRLGGHIVQGHVDGVGEVVKVEQSGAAANVTFALPRELARYLVEKGSITVDGISLTVSSLSGERFSVALIPETLERTTLASTKVGDRVNLEVDVIAKYVDRLARPYGDR